MASDKFTNLNTDNSILNSLTKFNGFYTNIYRDPFIHGNSFIFVTKPMLFLDHIKPSIKDDNRQMAYINMTRDSTFTQFLKSEQLNELDDKIIKSLSYVEEYSESSFLPVFTNECKSFDVQDVTIESSEIAPTKQGYKQVLPTYTTASEAAGTISISVSEDSNLSFTKMLTLWVKYMQNVTDGTFDANPDMVLNGCIDYMSSIYYFVLDQDGKTIKYWCKYTGCWPTAIPYSQLTYNKGAHDPVDMTVTFQYMVKEDMNPKILEDFNIASFKLAGENRLEHSFQNYYASIVNSPLLNRDKILELNNKSSLLSSEKRDPLILYKPASSKGLHTDDTSARFELIFDDNGYKSELIENILENNNYYINDVANTSFVKEGIAYDSWDKSQFWDE